MSDWKIAVEAFRFEVLKASREFAAAFGRWRRLALSPSEVNELRETLKVEGTDLIDSAVGAEVSRFRRRREKREAKRRKPVELGARVLRKITFET